MATAQDSICGAISGRCGCFPSGSCGRTGNLEPVTVGMAFALRLSGLLGLASGFGCGERAEHVFHLPARGRTVPVRAGPASGWLLVARFLGISA